jgi:uncharacterized OsmC-like protein/pimeloyl-ACP methyl ester carboxylesterase
MAQPHRVQITGPTGQILAGRLHLPAGEPRGWALFAHCFTCSKDLHAARVIAEGLAAEGFGVLRFDFTGLGESEGELADTTFSSNVDDLVAAAGWLTEHHRTPTLLVGHSLGGAAVIAAAARLPDVRAVATLGAPSDPRNLVRHLGEAADVIRAEGEAIVELAGRPFRIRRTLLDDLDHQSIDLTLRTLHKALLILHSPQDAVVPVDEARVLYEAARHPKSFVSLDAADHLLTRPADARYAATVIAAWASRYLPEPSLPPAEHPHDVEVRGGREGYANRIVAHGRHRLRADEPEAQGGTDTGPSPYELLTAALGACTSITLRMYADRKQWPLEEVVVHLEHDKRHADDCADCDPALAGKRIDHITRTIELIGPLDEGQRSQLLEIADRCPVHRTLHGPVHVATRLSDP